ncbi:hypothetical protein, partial [Enterobacter cloacae complex sp. 2DZ2F20B]|uniref:hypothetical protein n=1 Tax=Enterobacter cloacae complex sp. 2DZ2F20B TaxID=2511993 RepID=UPI001CA4A49A
MNFLSSLVSIYLVIGVTGYTILKFNQKGKCEERNISKSLNENCGFIAQFWTPFSTKNIDVYWSFYAYIYLSMQLLMRPNMLVTYNAYEVTEYLILKIKHLNQMLHECFDYADYQVSRTRLSKCILY